MELWFCDQDGIENFFDNWVQEEVNFCPYCGYQPERSKREDLETGCGALNMVETS